MHEHDSKCKLTALTTLTWTCGQIWSTARRIRACFQYFFVICHEFWGTPLSLVAPLLPSLPENVYETLPAVARLRCRAWHIARTNAKTLPVRRCPCRGHYAAGWSAWLVRRCYHPEALLDPARSCLTYLDMVKHQMKHSTQCQQYFLCLGFSLENSWRACSTWDLRTATESKDANFVDNFLRISRPLAAKSSNFKLGLLQGLRFSPGWGNLWQMAQWLIHVDTIWIYYCCFCDPENSQSSLWLLYIYI